jgi:hypothetical protein
VMRPRRCFSPLESSPGTGPRYAINAMVTDASEVDPTLIARVRRAYDQAG